MNKIKRLITITILTFAMLAVAVAGCKKRNASTLPSSTSSQSSGEDGTDVSNSSDETSEQSTKSDSGKDSDDSEKDTDDSKETTTDSEDSDDETTNTTDLGDETTTEKEGQASTENTDAATTSSNSTKETTKATEATTTTKATEAATTAKPTEATTTATQATEVATTTTQAETTTVQEETTTAAPTISLEPLTDSMSNHVYGSYTDDDLAAAKSIAESLVTSATSQEYVVKVIHDYLVNTITYTLGCHSIYDALVNKACVCQGYADAFSAICYYLGIEAHTAHGTATNSKGTESHAWNQVKVDGTWYNIDVTWDDPEDTLSYQYFLITDDKIKKDHTLKGVAGGTVNSCTSTTTTDYELVYAKSLCTNCIVISSIDTTAIAEYIHTYPTQETYYFIYDFGETGVSASDDGIYQSISDAVYNVLVSDNIGFSMRGTSISYTYGARYVCYPIIVTR